MVEGTTPLEMAKRAVTAATPHIERAVREQAARELIAYRDGLDRDNPALRTLRRHVDLCARRIGPKMTDREVVEALQRGDFIGCHLDDAGRAIPPAAAARGDGSGS